MAGRVPRRVVGGRGDIKRIAVAKRSVRAWARDRGRGERFGGLGDALTVSAAISTVTTVGYYYIFLARTGASDSGISNIFMDATEAGGAARGLNFQIAPDTLGDSFSTIVFAVGLWFGVDEDFRYSDKAMDVLVKLVENSNRKTGGDDGDAGDGTEIDDAGTPVTVTQASGSPPLALRLAVGALFLFAGWIATELTDRVVGDGDPIWSTALSIGLLFTSFVYEIGRKETYVSDGDAYIDFSNFARDKLQIGRSARCHETEIIKAFRRAFPRYRTTDQITDKEIVTMARQWCPLLQRSNYGYLSGEMRGGRVILEMRTSNEKCSTELIGSS